MDIERTPINAPLPCYAQGHNSALPKCQACPHKTGCSALAGDRAGVIEVGNLQYNLIPEKFGVKVVESEDPEFAMLQEVYVLCHNTVFKEDTRDSVAPYRRDIAARAAEAKLSIRTFMLSCMFGHLSTAENAVGHTESKTRAFTPKSLTYPSAPATARAYVSLCREKFGAFSLSAMTALTGEDFAKNDFESQMLASETTAGTYIIGWKLRNDGEPYQSLYESKEIDLNPYWLATCPHYEELILRRHFKEPYGSRLERSHRSAVGHAIRDMTRTRNVAKAVFYARQKAAPAAVKSALAFFGYRTCDFEVKDVPVTDMLKHWLDLSRVIQHVEALKYVNGEPSLLDRVLIEPKPR